MPLSIGKTGGGGLAEASFGKVDLSEISLGDKLIWQKTNPYPPGTMVLTIETTSPNQVVNLGYNLGRWQGDKSAAKYPTKGTVTWEEDSEPVAFNGTEEIAEVGNPLVHTYAEAGEHKITIKGVVKWNKVSTSSSNSSTSNSIREVLKSIEIPKNEISPIYYIDTYAFYYCKNLELIPGNLFENCTEVTNFSYCFYNTKITEIPQGLFDPCTQATNFDSCFSGTKITEIPQGLFDKCTQATNFNYCFQNTQITAIPERLFDSCTQVTNFNRCFANTKITTIPQRLFDSCTQAKDFSGCFQSAKITAIPTGLFDQCTQATDFSYCFQVAQITAIPEGLFDPCTQAKDFTYCFYNTPITKIPEGLFDSCTQATNFSYCFSGCTQITAIPEGLFANNHVVTNFSFTFNNCSKVEGNLPELWKLHSTATHTRCFYNCTKASNYNEAKAASWA